MNHKLRMNEFGYLADLGEMVNEKWSRANSPKRTTVVAARAATPETCQF
jgi:hypothetical protein